MTHEEEYIMINVSKCNGRCSGIGARRYYYYDCEYFNYYDMLEQTGSYNIKDLIRKLNKQASPEYNNNNIAINKRDKYTGRIIQTYKYIFHPFHREWEKDRIFK